MLINSNKLAEIYNSVVQEATQDIFSNYIFTEVNLYMIGKLDDKLVLGFNVETNIPSTSYRISRNVSVIYNDKLDDYDVFLGEIRGVIVFLLDEELDRLYKEMSYYIVDDPENSRLLALGLEEIEYSPHGMLYLTYYVDWGTDSVYYSDQCFIEYDTNSHSIVRMDKIKELLD